MNIHFTKDFAEPGENITVSATADANTPVLIGIIDTSLMLLAESCKSLQSSSVRDLIYVYCHIMIDLNCYYNCTDL